ncbi:hypothetical protein J3R83DRAFT_5573 [Lanmaoa asiatica]|nr:hypothetical protein J3R83DRAFT_5573 [Lanmaoa asiatica]
MKVAVSSTQHVSLILSPPSSTVGDRPLPETLTSSAQWELPSIPQGVGFGEASGMASLGWSEDSMALHVPPPVLLLYPGSRSASGKVGLLTSSMSASWHRLGILIVIAIGSKEPRSAAAAVDDGRADDDLGQGGGTSGRSRDDAV